MLKAATLLMVSVSLLGWGDWEGESYAKSLAPGKRDGFGAVSRVDCQEGGRILDVGCGDGGISARLAAKFSGCEVVGIDLSPSMVGYAQKLYGTRSNLSFRVGDARFLGIDQEFDLIVSFATMHWIKEQGAALAEFYRALKPEGRVFLQFPIQLPDPFYKALEQTLADPLWEPYFVDYAPPWTFYHLGEYLFFLYDAGFLLSDMRVFISDEAFPSKEAFQQSLSEWLPYLERLPEERKHRFLVQLVENYVVLAPGDEAGQVFFHEPLLEVECNKLNY